MDDAECAWSEKLENTPENQLMKKFLLATVALVALGATVPALAADLPARTYTKAPAYAAPLYNWTGFYIGGHVGGAFNGDQNIAGLTTGNNNDGRFLGGVQAGYDYQFAPNWVLGIEGQYSWLGSNNNGIVFPGGFIYTNNQRALASVTGRVGYTWGPALLYVKGGYAFSDNNESLVNGRACFVRQLPHRRSRREGWSELSLQLGWPGRREVLIRA
jgi:outer membrane immunogenic protein